MGQDRSVTSEPAETQPTTSEMTTTAVLPAQDVRERHTELVELVNTYRTAYYSQDSPNSLLIYFNRSKN